MKANIRIGDVCEILNGFAFKSDEYVEDGIRVMRITNVQKGAVVDDEPKYFPAERASEISRFLLREGDLLMSLTGNVGRVGLLPKELLPAALNQRVACLRLKDDGVLMKYLFYILNSDSFETDCIFNASGIAQKNMSTRWLESYDIPIPPISEQERIIAELDLLTSIIDKQKAQLKELDNLAQSIFYDMFGNPVENEKGWEKGCVSELCCPKKEILRASKSFSSSDVIEYIDISSIDNKKNIMTSTSSVVFSDAPSRAQQVVIKDDILVSLVRPNLKNVAVVNRDDNNLVASSGFCVLRHLPSISYEFLFYITKSEAFTEYLMQRVSGANYPAVREEDIKDYPTIVPPIELQESFAKKIQSIESQKASINRSIEESQKLFDYTMDKYFG